MMKMTGIYFRVVPSLLLLMMVMALTYTNCKAQPTLKQVHVIARHGARTNLPKTTDSLLEEQGSTLTPLGQKQMYDLGVWLRQTYNTNGFLEFYNPSLHRLDSSNLDRTLTSANSLSLGLFPLNAQAGLHGAAVFTSMLPEMPSIPVYTRQERNDVTIRAYRNCPKFYQKIVGLYTSRQWGDLEKNNEALLTKLAETFPDYVKDDTGDGAAKTIALKDLYNVYDPIHVARTECGGSDGASSYSCLSLEDGIALSESLTDLQFDDLEHLMEQTERMKFGLGTAGNLLGSNLLWQILTRATDPDDKGTFFLYSAHAPTILGLLSTIREASEDESFVEYASSVIVEIYQDSQTKDSTIRFLYKAANSQTARYLALKHVKCDERVNALDESNYNNVHCSLTKFVSWSTKNTLSSEEDWCEACGNELADVCMEALLAAATNSSSLLQDLTEVMEENGNEPVVIAATFFGGFFGGLIFMALCCACTTRRRERYNSTTSEEGTPKQEAAPPAVADGSEVKGTIS
jgi:hypothetical protein